MIMNYTHHNKEKHIESAGKMCIRRIKKMGNKMKEEEEKIWNKKRE